MKNWHKTLFTIFITYGFTISPGFSAEKDNPPWLLTALKLQREIDLETPLREATFIGTHNSYNSKSYQTATRYLDPNQQLSIFDQLEAGVRSIELDAHWTLSSNFSHEILLCHGRPNHIGCGIFDRPFKEGLAELHDWLKQNPGEVVLLYIERHLDQHEALAAEQLKAELEDFIFKPSVVRQSDREAHACVALPTKLTKADILRAGKQLLIVSKDCDTLKTEFNDYVFAGIGDIPSLPFTFIDEKIGSFTPFPDCSKSNVFSPDPDHTSLWRIYEDRTVVGSVLVTQKYLYDKDMQELIHCGINWPSMDMLASYDSRLLASIWSWAPNYPRENQGQCAIYKYDEGFQNIPCDKTISSYACYEENTHTLKAITGYGPWANGKTSCKILAGNTWRFAVPVNAQQLDNLKESMKALSIKEIWLNYAVDQQGNWKANG